uniref:Uncharacterized protein n=1 Tax=Propithecus coquereli TaxID=379532 RepID=A0A2K6EVL3_PROCO
MEKEKVNYDGKPDPENSVDFTEHFNQLHLLETHGHLILVLRIQANGFFGLLKKKNWLTTVWRLLSGKATHVNARDEDEYIPLHRAACSGHLDMVHELIAQGADVHAVTVDGWTPLHSACTWNDTRVASFFLQHDADVSAQTKGLLTPLHLAAGNRDSKDTLELILVNRYIKPGLKNSLEETTFGIARRTSIYHYLFETVEGCTHFSPQS